MQNIDVSVIVALNDEEGSVAALCSRVACVFQSLGMSYELILVDDGSNDGTYTKMVDLHRGDINVNIVRLNRNVGQTLSFMAGLRYARGRVIITMDGDLQHSPEDIPRLLERLRAGYAVVCGRKERRADNFFIKVIPSWVGKKIVAVFFGSHIYDINSTFRACPRELLDKFAVAGEAVRFLPLLIHEKDSVCEIEIDCHKRNAGTTHFHFWGRLARIVKDVKLLWGIKTATLKNAGVGLDDIVGSRMFHDHSFA